MTTILVVDNYDSFVFNLVQYLEQLGADCIVRRNDAVTTDEVARSRGRRDPAVARARYPGGRRRHRGHGALGGRPAAGLRGVPGAPGDRRGLRRVVDRAEELLHGRTSLVEHAGAGVLAGLPDPFTATRYHSLAVVDGTVPAELEVTARTTGGVIMGLRHREYAIEGVQFHPESVLTQGVRRALRTRERHARRERRGRQHVRPPPSRCSSARRLSARRR